MNDVFWKLPRQNNPILFHFAVENGNFLKNFSCQARVENEIATEFLKVHIVGNSRFAVMFNGLDMFNYLIFKICSKLSFIVTKTIVQNS